MTAPGLHLPVCQFAAWHKDYPTHTFYCDLPVAHDGRHAHQVALGVWVHWDVTMVFASAPPPNPADTPAVVNSIPVEHRHHGHEVGGWYWACCACTGLNDPGCLACARAAGRLDPPTPAAPEPEPPFDRSREKFFTGVCVYPGCYGDLTGRSLDGADPYWWHDMDILDNDHDADPGKR